MQFSWKKIEHTSMNAKSKMSYQGRLPQNEAEIAADF